MRKGENFNRPAPGREIKVDPIKCQKDIKAIKRLLADNPQTLPCSPWGSTPTSAPLTCCGSLPGRYEG